MLTAVSGQLTALQLQSNPAQAVIAANPREDSSPLSEPEWKETGKPLQCVNH